MKSLAMRATVTLVVLFVVVWCSNGCGGKPSRKPGPNSGSARGKALSERTQLIAALSATLSNWDESHSDEEQRKLALNQLNAWSESANPASPSPRLPKASAGSRIRQLQPYPQI